jgi:hypothetical protein
LSVQTIATWLEWHIEVTANAQAQVCIRMVKATTKNQFMEEQTGIIPTSLFRIGSQLKYNSFYLGYVPLIKTLV